MCIWEYDISGSVRVSSGEESQCFKPGLRGLPGKALQCLRGSLRDAKDAVVLQFHQE